MSYPFSISKLKEDLIAKNHKKLIKTLEDAWNIEIDIIKYILYYPIREIRELDNCFCTFGVYFISDKYDVIYIGSSKSVKKRISRHFFTRTKTNINISIFVLKNYEDAYLLENISIERIRPKYNYGVSHHIINGRYSSNCVT